MNVRFLKHLQHLIVLCTVFALASLTAVAQETMSEDREEQPVETQTLEKIPRGGGPPWIAKPILELGLVGGFALDFHSATDLKLPGVPSCCPGYDGGTGSGFVVAASVGLPLSDDLTLLTRLSYHGSGVTMNTAEPTTVRVGNEPVETTLNHELKPTLSFLSIEPSIEYRMSNLGFIGGVRLGTLMGGTYTQTETLDPGIPYDFDDGTGVRNSTSGDITETTGFHFGLIIGARYHLPMNSNRTMELLPEIQFAPLFTSVVQDQSWSVSSLRVMIGFSYKFKKWTPISSPLKP